MQREASGLSGRAASRWPARPPGPPHTGRDPRPAGKGEMRAGPVTTHQLPHAVRGPKAQRSSSQSMASTTARSPAYWSSPTACKQTGLACRPEQASLQETAPEALLVGCGAQPPSITSRPSAHWASPTAYKRTGIHCRPLCREAIPGLPSGVWSDSRPANLRGPSHHASALQPTEQGDICSAQHFEGF